MEIKNAYKIFVRKTEENVLLMKLGIDRRIVLKWIIRTWCECVDFINLSQGRVQW
jgi:hypothetical protein